MVSVNNDRLLQQVLVFTCGSPNTILRIRARVMIVENATTEMMIILSSLDCSLETENTNVTP